MIGKQTKRGKNRKLCSFCQAQSETNMWPCFEMGLQLKPWDKWQMHVSLWICTNQVTCVWSAVSDTWISLLSWSANLKNRRAPRCDPLLSHYNQSVTTSVSVSTVEITCIIPLKASWKSETTESLEGTIWHFGEYIYSLSCWIRLVFFILSPGPPCSACFRCFPFQHAVNTKSILPVSISNEKPSSVSVDRIT